jgi:hypothetical protein
MYDKKILIPIVFILLVSALVIPLTQYWGNPLKDIIVGIVAYTLYGLLIAVYFLRFALIFLGVFAVYRILRERYEKQLAV